MDAGWTLVECKFGTCSNLTGYVQASFYVTQVLRRNIDEMVSSARWADANRGKIKELVRLVRFVLF